MNDRCEGYRRTGGAFTLGPVKWKQCKNDSIVRLIIIQDGKKGDFPACEKCWEECIEKQINILEVQRGG